ncbi:serine hydrolase [Flavobacterium granuli]|uniref:CubicO group peptidase (Beta-lactamase class C family) n=1 Tax=Flavobacterium granuli TaxID=280093 RepID=A0ABU1S4P9_9FLAO|nr:serine hydrolase [Flavobacterium granuli]MDR6846021.1 CubicO group peptidase (beta-lactamase class C family) [Flavobacterium granuli]
MATIKSLLSVFMFCMLLSNNPVNAQLSANQVDSLVQKAMKEFNVAGIAVAIVKDGAVIHEKGYGIKSIDTKLPVDEYTNFQIASNSKAFTTAGLAILIDEGKLNWKDKVKTYLPEFKMYNDYVTEHFTVEDLLCHRSGLGLGAGDLMDFPDGANFTIEDKLSALQYFKPVSEFRTKYDYDNQLYVIAGELTARVSGMTWEKFIQTRILDPLQMTNSFSSLEAINDRTNLATAHTVEMGDGKMKSVPLYQKRINGASGGILSNVHDMSKWMIMQLNNGKYGVGLEKQLFTAEKQKEMWAIHTAMDVYTEPRYKEHFHGYGLGWELTEVRGNLRASHTGSLLGMLSRVTLIPDLNLGIVILTNTESSGGAANQAINKIILDSYLGLDHFDWIAKYSKDYQSKKGKGDTILTEVWETVAKAKNTKINTSDYIGIYEDKWFGKIEIAMKGNQLWFKSLRSPKLNGPMSFYKENTFAIKWEYKYRSLDAFAVFNLDEKGKAQSIKMKGISPNINFSYDFQDLDLQRIKK